MISQPSPNPRLQLLKGRGKSQTHGESQVPLHCTGLADSSFRPFACAGPPDRHTRHLPLSPRRTPIISTILQRAPPGCPAEAATEPVCPSLDLFSLNASPDTVEQLPGPTRPGRLSPPRPPARCRPPATVRQVVAALGWVPWRPTLRQGGDCHSGLGGDPRKHGEANSRCVTKQVVTAAPELRSAGDTGRGQGRPLRQAGTRGLRLPPAATSRLLSASIGLSGPRTSNKWGNTICVLSCLA